MGYEHIIAARQKLQALGVRHFDGGGFVQNLLTNPSKTLTVQNGYQAQAPGIQTMDFTPYMGDARADIGRGQGVMGQAAGQLGDVGRMQVADSGAIGTEAGAVSGLAGAQGLGGVLSQQQTLGQALQAQANGQGPNPAQEQYKQNVNQAIAQNAGMIASQKGINPALAARLASQNAASMTQGAASNAAQLQAEQQLAAEGQLGNVLQAQGNTVMGQGQLHSTAGGLVGQRVSALGQAGQTFSGAGSLGNAMAGQGNQFYGTNLSGQGNQNNAVNTGSLGAQGINAGVASGNQKYTEGTQAGLLNALGGATGLGGTSGGGGGGGGSILASLAPLAAAFAGGGEVSDQSQGVLARILAQTDQSGPYQAVSFGGGGSPSPAPAADPGTTYSGTPTLVGPTGEMQTTGTATGDYLNGDMSTGSFLGGAQPGAAPAYNGPLAPPAYARGGRVDGKAMCLAQALMARGGQVPGTPQFPGNDRRNDVVPAVLSKGEVVLPNSVTQAPDAPEKAARFLAAIKERDGAAKEPAGYGHVLTKVRALRSQIADLEKHLGRAS